MANLNLSNFIVDRVISGVGYRSDDSVLFKMDQCQNTSITCGSESTDIVDNVGSPIMTLYRSKTCEISGENAILDFNITAFQMGMDEKNVASEGNIVTAPAQEVLNVTVKGGSCDLKNVAKEAPAFLYALNKDSSLGEKYKLGTDASETEFAYEVATRTVTVNGDEKEIEVGVIKLPTSVDVGTQMFVSYEYNATSAVEIVNSAKDFPKSCKLVLRVLGYNPCNKDNKLGAYIIFPSFEMSPDFDLSLNVGEAQSWSGKASQDFCSKDRALMRIVVVDEDDDLF